MTVQMTRPEIGSLIEQRLQIGASGSVEDSLLDTLETQRDREWRLVEDRSAMGGKVGRWLAPMGHGGTWRRRYAA